MAADGVVRERLPDETLLVFLSDTHIGGSSGSDIFESAAELTLLLEDLHHHQGPVELVLVGDFLDLLRMGEVGRGEDLVAATLARSEYRELFATLRAFAGAEGHRVVYVVGNHDAELWWNPRIRRTLQEAGLVALLGVAAWAQRNLRIRQFADEERDLSLALATRHWYRPALAVVVTAFGLLGWLLYDPLGLASARLAVALVGLGGVVVIIASSVPMWNEILRYAQGGPAGGDRSGPAPGMERS